MTPLFDSYHPLPPIALRTRTRAAAPSHRRYNNICVLFAAHGYPKVCLIWR